MAVWQFDLLLIPRDMAVPYTGKPNWEPFLPQRVAYAVQEDLCHYFGPPWFMLKNWLVFGPENGSRIDVLFEADGSANFSARVDMRNESPQFLVLLTDLARLHGCVFFSPDTAELVKPEVHQIVAAITRYDSRNLDLL
ncbi:hypothetical protein GTP46_11415 [Duganella sp. FT135W]|uniref:Uncharacterized protein n=1 Tax=Duganella flavida TaxID=2692175 RepID=A0A6L8KBM7_9BURK|nr:hypothetical protein [Duganella flavida]MYM23254.1 hypothetical protein [Duganella flavida]